jgi:hypothetical protein
VDTCHVRNACRRMNRKPVPLVSGTARILAATMNYYL